MSKKMSFQDAVKKAQSIWKTGGVDYNPHRKLCCMIGHVVMGMFFKVEGSGKTWEEAFQNYLEKKQKECDICLRSVEKEDSVPYRDGVAHKSCVDKKQMRRRQG